MDKSTLAQNLLSTLTKVKPLYVAAQDDMLAAREALELAERNYKEVRITALANASGKNADIREAQANADSEVEYRREELEARRSDFASAYRIYKQQESDMQYIRDATALLREVS